MENTSQTPKQELMHSALEHYEEAATELLHWHSDIPKAIKHYYQYENPLQELANKLNDGMIHPEKDFDLFLNELKKLGLRFIDNDENIHWEFNENEKV